MLIFALGLSGNDHWLLAEEGLTIHTEKVNSSADLLEELRQGNYDGLLMNLDRISWSAAAVPLVRATSGILAIVGCRERVSQELWSNARTSFLNAGGDDVVGRPINPKEILATLQAHHRRISCMIPTVITITTAAGAVIVINPISKTITVDGGRVNLTIGESRLFFCMAESEKPQTRDQLLNKCYGHHDALPKKGIIDVRIVRIRKKLFEADRRVSSDADSIIKTVRGTGYQLRRM